MHFKVFKIIINIKRVKSFAIYILIISLFLPKHLFCL